MAKKLNKDVAPINEELFPWLKFVPEKYRIIGPSIEHNAQLLDTTTHEFINYITSTPSNFCYKPTGEILTFLPGHKILGAYGPSPAQVMVIGKFPMPEDMSALRYFSGNIGDEWKDILRSQDINFDSWYATCTYKFNPKGVSKANADLNNECISLLYYELFHVRPEYIVCMGADAVKALFGSKATLEQYRGQVVDFEFPGEFKSKVICTCTPSEVLRSPEIRPVMAQDLSQLVDLLKGVKQEEKIPVSYRHIETFEDLDSWIDEIIAGDFKVFAVDCEWAGESCFDDPNTSYLRSIQFCWDVGKACYLNLVDEAGNKKLISKGKAFLLEKLEKVLYRKKDIILLGHQLRADLPWLMDLGFEGEKFENLVLNSFDTMLALHCLDETSKFGLDVCALRYTDLGRYDTELRNWLKSAHTAEELDTVGYRYVPTSILFPYGCKDVDATFRIAMVFMSKLQDAHINDLSFNEFYEDGTPITLGTLFYNIENKATLPLLEMETNGLNVDMERFEKLIAIYSDVREKVSAELRVKINWPDFNFRSVDQVRMLLFSGQDFKDKKKDIVPPGAKVFNFTPIKSSDKKAPPWHKIVAEGSQKLYGPSTDSDVLGDLLITNKDNEILTLLRDIRFIDQACKTFLRDKDEETGEYEKGLCSAVKGGKIRTNISQLAETGRYKSYNPNLQNLPSAQEKALHTILARYGYKNIPKIRSCFMAPPGEVLVSCDFKQAELFVMAWLSQDKAMMDILSDPARNLHLEAANQIFKLGYDLTKCSAEETEAIKDKHKNEYIRAKAVNFGIPYGSGGSGLASRLRGEGVNVSPEEGNEYVKAHASLFTQLHEFLNGISDLVSDPGYLRTVYGRYRRFPYTKDNTIRAKQEREAKNCPIQGTVADNLTKAIIKFWEYRRKNKIKDYKLLLPVHDQIIFSVKPKYVKKFITDVIPKCMIFPIPKINISLDADIEVYCRWSEKSTVKELINLGVDETIANVYGKKD